MDFSEMVSNAFCALLFYERFIITYEWIYHKRSNMRARLKENEVDVINAVSSCQSWLLGCPNPVFSISVELKSIIVRLYVRCYSKM